MYVFIRLFIPLNSWNTAKVGVKHQSLTHMFIRDTCNNLFWWVHRPRHYHVSDCPVPVKTNVGQVDFVSWLSEGTSKKNDCPIFWRLFSMIKMCCFVILTDKNFINNYFNVFKNIGFHWSTLSLIITVNQEIFRTYTWSVSFQRFD